MAITRTSAIVHIELPSGAFAESLPLTSEREFHVTVTVAGTQYPAGIFRSPINDEQWRDFRTRLRDCNVNRSDSGFNAAQSIRALGGKLFAALAALTPKLRDFLTEEGTPRRLVIQTTRTELHLLPWGALYDPEADLLAAGDLSIVQAWDTFSESPLALTGRLNLVRVLGSDTNKSSVSGLKGLPPEISQTPGGPPDILHLEEHGNAALTEIGGVRATKFAQSFGKTGIALLWSCYSGAANSWGQSPALCLHREGAALVLSFQAELNNLDATSISEAFYADVFGPAASRDPESALLRIRVAKYTKEFEYANWASMMLYLRAPLDLSALPLNGERVPKALWIDDAAKPSTDWPAQPLAFAIATVQPGSQTSIPDVALYIPPRGKLPRSITSSWRGNVIRLDGGTGPLSDAVLRELNLDPRDAPRTDVSDKLVWFFSKIVRYGAPLILWTGAAPHQLEFLKSIEVSSTLTFLLVCDSNPNPSLIELVDRNRLQQAQSVAQTLPPDCIDDDLLSAAYFAFARCEKPDEARGFLDRVQDSGEKLLLSGNFVSRFRTSLNGAPASPHEEEDLYRQVINLPGASPSLIGRARHELGYYMSCQGRAGTAEIFYRLALEDLERSPVHDSRWQFALAATLRDWADLIALDPARLPETSALLRRALAIHTFHGRTLEVAYCLVSAARIALTGSRHTEAIEHVVDASNRFESCRNWRGWSSAVNILLETLAETRQTTRMLSLVEAAVLKIDASDIKPRKKAELIQSLAFKRAQAHWIAGDLSRAHILLTELLTQSGDDFVQSSLFSEVRRLQQFLAPAQPEGFRTPLAPVRLP